MDFYMFIPVPNLKDIPEGFLQLLISAGVVFDFIQHSQRETIVKYLKYNVLME